jgi:hypothetical protein
VPYVKNIPFKDNILILNVQKGKNIIAKIELEVDSM